MLQQSDNNLNLPSASEIMNFWKHSRNKYQKMFMSSSIFNKILWIILVWIMIFLTREKQSSKQINFYQYGKTFMKFQQSTLKKQQSSKLSHLEYIRPYSFIYIYIYYIYKYIYIYIYIYIYYIYTYIIYNIYIYIYITWKMLLLYFLLKPCYQSNICKKIS